MQDAAAATEEPAGATVPDPTQEMSRFEAIPRPLRAVILLMSATGTAMATGYIFGWIHIFNINYYFLLIAVYLPSAFLLLPAGNWEKVPGPLSYIPALATFFCAGLLSLHGKSIALDIWVPTSQAWQFYVALSLFILIIEAARRSGGLIFVSIVIVLGLYPIYADQMPDILWASPTSFSRTIAYNIYSNSGLLGVLIQVIGETIIGYLIFASLLVTTGASDFFLNFANACMGRAKGGAGKVSVLASGFFGSLSGSIFSNIISTGTMTIPSMKRGGLPAHYAGALEACASTGGMLMPPVMGAVAFIMADFTGTSYSTIVVAAAIPSILYYFGLYWHVHSYAERHELDGIPQDELPSISKTIREGWPILLVLAFLVWALVFMRWERLAPFYASALLLVFTSLRKSTRLSLKSIPGMLFEINKLLSQAMALLLPISFILGGLMATGVAPNFTSALVTIGHGNIVLVLAIGIVVCMIFGMLGMITAAYLMLALTLAPALEQIGGLNTVAIHLFIAYYAALAAITPPVALAAFLASRISGSAPMITSVHSARIGIVLYFIPIFFLFEPALIFQGPLGITAIWLVMNVIAIILIAGASEGYLTRFGALRGWSRACLFGAGLLIGFPEIWSTAVGFAVAIVVVCIPKLSRFTPATEGNP